MLEIKKKIKSWEFQKCYILRGRGENGTWHLNCFPVAACSERDVIVPRKRQLPDAGMHPLTLGGLILVLICDSTHAGGKRALCIYITTKT